MSFSGVRFLPFRQVSCTNEVSTVTEIRRQGGVLVFVRAAGNHITAALMASLMLSPGDGVAQEIVVDGDQNVLVEPVTSMAFIALPEGCFVMAEGIGEVCVDAMAMGRFEVTNRQFRAFHPEHGPAGLPDGLDDADLPVANVSWQDASAFADWLGQQSGLAIRLPSEAEWDYAARAGTRGVWFWGDDGNQAFRYANLSDRDHDRRLIDGFKQTAPIGSFDPNPFGLFDMLGNVSEWVADSYQGGADRYGGQTDNPVVAGEGPMRVRRGGSYDNTVDQVGSDIREFYLQSLGVPQTGFRLVLEIE